MAIFSTRPSYSWSPSRRKYVRACGFETTAIIPFGARTMPSRRNVLTCKPSLPGGRFGPGLFCLPIKDSNGSRRACFTSLSAAASAVPGVERFSTALTAGFAALLAFPAVFVAALAPVVLAAGLPAGLGACGEGLLADGAAGLVVAGAAGLAACGAGLVAAAAAGLAVCCAGLLACPSADFPLLGVDGLACARNSGVAAAIKIPSPRVIAERIVRSFPLRVFQPHQLQAWPQQREPHPRRRAW